jgi:cytochrome P450
MRKNPIEFFTQLAAELGDIVHFSLGSETHYYFLNHPDLVKQVLVDRDRSFAKWFAVDRIREVLGEGLFVSEGELHFCQRRLAQPAFHRERIGNYADTMVAMAVELMDSWNDGQTIDVCRDMNVLAMRIVAKTLFGIDVQADAKAINDALTVILDQFERSILPEAEQADFQEARQRLYSAIDRIVEARRSSRETRDDLLELLLAAEDKKGAAGKQGDRQVRDEALTIFLAGHETTANAIAWTWYLLSQHPDVEGRFLEEVDRVLNGRPATFEDFPRLSYTTMIFSEALRLYPPLWIVGRRALADCEIGEYRIPAGSIVLVSQYVSHRDARYFPEPARFAPERWTSEERAARPKFAYFPFSGGSRSCLGEHFAWMEGILCLATIAQKYRLRLVADHPVVLQPQLTLRARHGIRMRLETRACSEVGGNIDRP